jgi:hypothetical protein
MAIDTIIPNCLPHGGIQLANAMLFITTAMAGNTSAGK